MPPRDWAFRVQDILDAIAKTQRYVSGVYASQLPRKSISTFSAADTSPAHLQSRPLIEWSGLDFRALQPPSRYNLVTNLKRGESAR
jgi:hypothetical protein